jgi:hypothetical protein
VDEEKNPKKPDKSEIGNFSLGKKKKIESRFFAR